VGGEPDYLPMKEVVTISLAHAASLWVRQLQSPTRSRAAVPGEVIHIPAPGSALPVPGTELVAEIDWEARYRLMRMHTCPAPVVQHRPRSGDRRSGFRRQGTARFRRARVEPRQGDARGPPQRADYRSTPGRAAMDYRRGARRPARTRRTMSVKRRAVWGRCASLKSEVSICSPAAGTHIRNTSEIGPGRGDQDRRTRESRTAA